MTAGGSRVIRHSGGGWAGVEPTRYKEDGGPFLGVVRHTLLGYSDSEPDLNFEVRYFEVAPGGYTTLERHAHPHAVLVLTGGGTVRLGDRLEVIRAFDAVYVAPHEIHRFEADPGEHLGILCVVDRHRDRPEAVDEASLT
jgi:quercetin dioxygenase-like cupin family protein